MNRCQAEVSEVLTDVYDPDDLPVFQEATAGTCGLLSTVCHSTLACLTLESVGGTLDGAVSSRRCTWLERNSCASQSYGDIMVNVKYRRIMLETPVQLMHHYEMWSPCDNISLRLTAH